MFTHFSAADLNLTGQFWFEDAPDQALLANRAEVRDVLESHDVAMAMNGHLHWNDHTVHNGISYITIQSLVENANRRRAGPPTPGPSSRPEPTASKSPSAAGTPPATGCPVRARDCSGGP